MEIIPANLLDLGPLRKLEQVCFPTDAWPLLDLITVLGSPSVVRLKAVENGQMIGFIAGDRIDGIGWVATVGVLPEYRHRGIGQALIEACEAQLKFDRVRLCVRESNLEAIRLYGKLGYQVVDTWYRYYKDGSNALVMEKNRAH
jgi:[ribosomal protein S18]-alanine N-acetyltransferase